MFPLTKWFRFQLYNFMKLSSLVPKFNLGPLQIVNTEYIGYRRAYKTNVYKAL